MTHSQTQGAEGAGTSLDDRLRAAGMFTVPEMMGETPLTRWQTHAAMTSLDAFEWWLDTQVRQYLTMKAEYEIGDKPKDDELYEWVLAHSGAFHVIRTNFRAAKAATPAPAATPGVPDSVRALSEAASPDWRTNGATPYILGPPIDGDNDRFEVIARGPAGCTKDHDRARQWQADRMFAVAAVNYVRTLIAAQPAGQAGDAGEVKPDPIRLMKEALFACLAEGTHDRNYGGVLVAGGKKAWLRFSVVDAETSAALAAGKPAPDSTRTGAAETEDDAPIDDVDAWSRHWSARHKPALAARPEAPSDAGWRERVRHVKRGTEYEVLGEAEAQVSTGESNRFGEWRALYERNKLTVYRCTKTGKLWCRFTDEFRDGRFETITPPSDPAPSGQAEG